MAADASIYGQIAPVQPVNRLAQLAQALQVGGLQQDQQLNRLKMDEYQRGIQEQEGLRNDLSQPGADPYQALLRRGRLKDATEWQKGQNDIAKTKSETAKAGAETAVKKLGVYREVMFGINDPQSAAMVIQKMHADPDLKGSGVDAVPLEQLLSQIPQDPAQFGDFKNKFSLGADKFITDLRARQQQAETGRHNQATEANTVRGQNLSAQTTMRGQNMVDSRAREANDIQKQASRTQVLETPDGVMLVDKGTGQARPATTNGKPLAGKPSAAVEKEMLGLRQQDSIIDGAISAVDQTPSAFGMGRGLATMAGSIPESIAGRMDSDAERQARSYVFNNVSKVINERAGAAQSAQELARLRSFLPAETDNADQIKSKLQAFKTYLSDMKAGTAKPAAGGATGSWGGGWSIQKVN